MSTQAKTKSKSQKKNGASSIVWFEIPADNVERARTFYGKLFGWKIESRVIETNEISNWEVKRI